MISFHKQEKLFNSLNKSENKRVWWISYLSYSKEGCGTTVQMHGRTCRNGRTDGRDGNRRYIPHFAVCLFSPFLSSFYSPITFTPDAHRGRVPAGGIFSLARASILEATSLGQFMLCVQAGRVVRHRRIALSHACIGIRIHDFYRETCTTCTTCVQLEYNLHVNVYNL